MKSICFVAPNLYTILKPGSDIHIVGGAEVQQKYIAQSLVKSGYEVSAICLDFGQKNEVVIDGIKVLKSFKLSDGLPIIRFVYPRIYKIWMAMKIANADVYYQRCAGMLTGVVAEFCRRNNKKFVFSGAHDTDFVPGKHLIQYKRDALTYRYGLKKANTILVQNDTQKKLLKSNFNLNGVVIPNCYSLVEGVRRVNNVIKNKIIWVSTIRKWKRPELFIEMAKALPDYEFILIGGAGASHEDKALFANLELKCSELKNIHMTGFVPLNEVGAYFDKAVLFINTSESEGFPNTFLQSWSRAVVTLSIFKLLINGGCAPGIYVDDIGHLVKEVDKLMIDHETRQLLGEECKKYFQQYFSVEIVSKQITSIL